MFIADDASVCSSDGAGAGLLQEGTRASPPPERPLRGLPGKILPEFPFPCLRSRTTVASSVPAFLPRKPAVGSPLHSAMVALGPPDHSNIFGLG
jgi:hypothetical protein